MGDNRKGNNPRLDKNGKPYAPAAGAVWRGKSKNGTPYIRISLNMDVCGNEKTNEKNQLQLVGFKNDHKEEQGEKAPDYFLKISEPFEKQNGKGKPGGFKGKPAPQRSRADDDDEDSDKKTTAKRADSEEDDDSLF